MIVKLFPIHKYGIKTTTKININFLINIRPKFTKMKDCQLNREPRIARNQEFLIKS